MLRAEWIEQAAGFSAATLHEAAGKVGVLPPAIKPIHPRFSLCGPALLVQSAPRDNLWIHRAMAAAKPQEILVVDVGGAYEAGYWGEVMNVSALALGLGGLVLNGCIRDTRAIAEADFPVFARGSCIQGTTKHPDAHGALDHPMAIEGVQIAPGDLVRGDEDGVVILPIEAFPDVLEVARERERKEALSMEQLRQGRTTLELRGWRGSPRPSKNPLAPAPKPML